MKKRKFPHPLHSLFLFFLLFLVASGFRMAMPEPTILATIKTYSEIWEKGATEGILKFEISGVTKGILKKGDKVDVKNEDNQGGTLLITRILVGTTEKTQLGPGETGFIFCKNVDASSVGVLNMYGSQAYMLNPGATPPNYVEWDPNPPVGVQEASSASNPGAPQLTCKLNGKAWSANGFYSSALYYVQGISYMQEGKPFMTLAFKSAVAPDSRQLTFQFIEFDGKTGTWGSDRMEVLLSGAEDGIPQHDVLQGVKKKAPSDFKVVITSWAPDTEETKIVSGTFSGKLPGILGAPSVTVTEGVFKDVKVRVYSEKY